MNKTPKNQLSKCEILGIGAPLLDHLLPISEEYLQKIPGEKWGMEVIDHKEMRKIIEESGVTPIQVVGGSSQNTIRGLARFGHQCAVTGKIGQDAIGKFVKKQMQELLIDTAYSYSSTPTAQVLSLITPDGKRTMRYYGGASNEITPEDLDPRLFEGIKLVHIEGYTLLYPGLTRRGMELAKQAGAKVSFDLGSFEMVKNYRELIMNLLENYVDLVFANEEEIDALVNHGPEEGCRQLSALCEVGVVMLGEKGSLVGRRAKVKAYPAFPVKPLDTTGAGDLFVSGFLHGYLLGRPDDESARYGAITGSAVTQYVGAEIPAEEWPKIQLCMEK